MKKIQILFLTVMLFTLAFFGAVSAANLPQILSDDDAELYTEIFRLQDSGNFTAAVKLESQVSDKILMGEVLHQRYMSKGYRSKLAELNAWMVQYSKHPGADEIYKLALKKGGTKLTTRPPQMPPMLGAIDFKAESEALTTGKYDAATDKKIAQFKTYLRKGKTLNAKNTLNDPSFRRALTRSDYGRLAGRLAFMYYADAMFDDAKKWGQISAVENSEYGLWTSGLLAFKYQDFSAAENHFDKMANLNHLGESRKAEAAFWAGRSADAAGRSSKADAYWKKASVNTQSFYGALSAEMLGNTPRFEFFEQDLTSGDIAEIMKQSYGMRGLALMQIGQTDAAEKQFRALATRGANDNLLHAVHILAMNANLPRTALTLGRIIRTKGILEIPDDIVSAAQYPVPEWEPLGGWGVDRALIFAIIRQESAFKSNAKSNAGAFGVMQIMPKTAKTVAKQNQINLSNLDLANPDHNVYLGQTLISGLLLRPHIDNNLIKLMASYNAGEGNMLAWQKKFKTEDPLLYIESFPAKETREYIKIVMTNMWLYRARLGQNIDGVASLANGEWPMYSELDDMAALNAKINSEF